MEGWGKGQTHPGFPPSPTASGFPPRSTRVHELDMFMQPEQWEVDLQALSYTPRVVVRPIGMPIMVIEAFPELPHYHERPIWPRKQGEDLMFTPSLEVELHARFAKDWQFWHGQWELVPWYRNSEYPAPYDPFEDAPHIAHMGEGNSPGRPNFVTTFTTLPHEVWLVILDHWIGLETLKFWSATPKMPRGRMRSHSLPWVMAREDWIEGKFFPVEAPSHLWYLLFLGKFPWESLLPLHFFVAWFPPTMEAKRRMWLKNHKAKLSEPSLMENSWLGPIKHVGGQPEENEPEFQGFYFLSRYRLTNSWREEFPNHPFWREVDDYFLDYELEPHK